MILIFVSHPQPDKDSTRFLFLTYRSIDLYDEDFVKSFEFVVKSTCGRIFHFFFFIPQTKKNLTNRKHKNQPN